MVAQPSHRASRARLLDREFGSSSFAVERSRPGSMPPATDSPRRAYPSAARTVRSYSTAFHGCREPSRSRSGPADFKSSLDSQRLRPKVHGADYHSGPASRHWRRTARRRRASAGPRPRRQRTTDHAGGRRALHASARSGRSWSAPALGPPKAGPAHSERRNPAIAQPLARRPGRGFGPISGCFCRRLARRRSQGARRRAPRQQSPAPLPRRSGHRRRAG